MKAIQIRKFGPPKSMMIEEVSLRPPGRGEVLISISAAGVNPVDTYIRAGSYAVKPPLPYTPGNDGAGTVIETGEGVSLFKPGDRVYLSASLTGTYAEESLAREEELFPLPEKVSFEAGACLGIPYPTAYEALFGKARAEKGEWVLIHGGTGGVGLAAVQLAASKGIRVIATGSTEAGRKLAVEQGAETALDHSSEDYLEKVNEVTGSGVDIVLEMLANRNLGRDPGILNRGGRIIVIGSRGEVTINPRDLMMKDASILGLLYGGTDSRRKREIHKALQRELTEGNLRPVIKAAYPLEKAGEAHEAVMKPGAAGNIILTTGC